jgi:hypothetical protein
VLDDVLRRDCAKTLVAERQSHAVGTQQRDRREALTREGKTLSTVVDAHCSIRPYGSKQRPDPAAYIGDPASRGWKVKSNPVRLHLELNTFAPMKEVLVNQASCHAGPPF